MYKIILLFVILLAASQLNAATRTSTATGGVWSTGSTWVGGTAPGSGDAVIIATTGTGSVQGTSGTISCASLTINSGSVLTMQRDFTVSGATNITGTINFGSTSSTQRTMTFNGPVTLNSGAVWNETTTGTAAGFAITDNFTNNATTFTAQNTTHTFSGSGHTINGSTATVIPQATFSASITNNGILTVPSLTISGSGTIVLTNNGTITVSSSLSLSDGLTQGTTGILNIGGSISGSAALTATAAGNTVNYNGAAQSGIVTSYYNLTLSGSGAKTFATTPTVNGKLSMQGTATITVTSGVVTYGTGATLEYNTATARTATSEEWLTTFAGTGGVVITNTGAITMNEAKIFNASSPLTINSLATLLTNNLGLTFGGDFVNGGTLTAGSSPIIINNTAATQSISGFTTTGSVTMSKSGGGTATFTGNVSGGALTINGTVGTLDLGTGLTHTFSGVVSLQTGTLNGNSSTLIENAVSTTAWNGTGTVFTPGTGTVVFGASGNQTLSATTTTFNNLTISGSGTKTMGSATTVGGTLALTSGIFDAGANTLAFINGNTPITRVSGTLSSTGSMVFGTSGNTNGNAFTIPDGTFTTAPTISGLTVDRTNTLKLGNQDVTVNGPVTLTLGTLDANSHLLLGGSGTILYNGGSLINFNYPAPVATSLSPSSTLAGAGQFTLTVNGSSFNPNSVVRWNGTGLTTTFVSPIQLTAIVPAGNIVTAGTATVAVFSPAPGGGTSSGLTFNINNPVPGSITLNPASTLVGGAQFTLTVTGSNFNASSVVNWNGTGLATVYSSPTQLTATVPASNIAAVGTATVTVTNPAPGGGTSAGATFTTNYPVPTATSLSQNSSLAGDPQFTLTVTGSNFYSTSVVKWNGTNLATVYVSPTSLNATVTAANIASAGTATVTVFNTTPGGGTSSGLTFTINNPVPGAVSLSPSSATGGGSSFTLTVTGSNFVATSVVNWNGTGLTTTYVSGTSLTATVPAASIATPGTATVTVFNPAPGGGTSSPGLTFTINNYPVPGAASLSPTSATAGGAQFTLTVNGSNFISPSVVKWNGTNLTTTWVSATQLTAIVPAANIVTAGAATVTVFNPAPGGGTSSDLTFAINNPVPGTITLNPTTTIVGGAQFTLTVTGSNFNASSVVNWNGTGLATTFGSATQVTAIVPAANITTTGTQTVTVFNPAPGGGTSAGAAFNVNNPVPGAITLNPTSTTAGGADFILTVTGSNFIASSVINWNGTGIPTTYGSATSLTATVPAANIAAGGTPLVTVTNPTPGGGTTAGVTFTINNPVPGAATLSPSSITAGGSQFTLTVNGSNFNSQSVIRWAGTGLTTTYVSSTQLTAPVPAANIVVGGSPQVTVFNPTPGGGSSSALTFTINNPVPGTTSISPASLAAGGTQFTLTVNGSNFNSQSKVNWNGTVLATTYFSTIQLTAVVPASNIATPGTASITVFNQAPAGGTSTPELIFTFNNFPAPGAASLSPSSATAHGAQFTLTVTGSNFIASSVVNWNGMGLTTTYVSPTNLTAIVPAANIATSGTAAVTVFNPAPGGGTSGSLSFTINRASFSSTKTGNWNDPTVWSGGVVPGADDNVTIGNGSSHTVTVNVASACNTLTIGAPGFLGTSALKFNTGILLTVHGAISVSAGVIATTQLNVGAGILDATNQTISISTGLATTELDISTGTVTAGAVSGGTLKLTDAGILNLSGSGNPLNNTTFNNSTSSTVNFNGTSNQTVPATTYYNLTLSGSGIKTINSGTTVSNILSMEGTATASAAPGGFVKLQYDRGVNSVTAGPEWISPFAATQGVIIMSGTTTLNAAKIFNASIPLTINSGATLITGNNGLTFGGDFVNGGTLTAGSSPIVINGTAATQNIDGFITTGLVSMTKTGGGTSTFKGNVSGGALTINGTVGNLNLGSGLTHTFSGDISLQTGTLNGGTNTTLNVNSPTTTAWTGTGSVFTPGTGTVVFGGSGAQTIATPTTFNNLTINNSSGVTLSGNASVNGTLAFTNGRITTGSNNVTLNNSASVSGAGAGKYVFGNLVWNIPTGVQTKTFDIGDAVIYAPATVAFNNVTTAGTLTGRVTGADHTDILNSGINGAKSVNHAWSLTNSGLAFSNCNVTFNWVGVGTDADAGSDPASYVVAKLDGSTWTKPTVANPTATSIQATGITSFSDFQIGQLAIPPSITIAGGPFDFGAIINGSVTDSKSYTVSGDHLNGNIIIHPSSPVFLISITDPPTASNDITLSPIGESVPITNIFVRFSPYTSDGTHIDSITNTTPDISKSLSVIGTAIVSNEPSSPSSIAFGKTSGDTIVVNIWSGGGTGYYRTLVCKQGDSVRFVPQDGTTMSGVNSDFSLAIAKGDGSKVVGDGYNLQTVTVTGLTPGWVYYFAVYEYNRVYNCDNSQNYLSTPGTAVCVGLLPVELSTFTTSVNGRSILLNWETKTEKNSDRFEIERSLLNENKWTSIGSVKAAVLSNSPREYSFTEKNLQVGKYGYRLKMIDNDGTFEYSKVVESEIILPKDFDLSQNYPNPFNPSTKINYALPSDSKVILKIYNIVGAEVGMIINEEQAAGYYTVEFSSAALSKNLASGIYFYRLIANDKVSGKNFTFTKKMILLK